MSVEPTVSTISAAEQNIEVRQESSQSSSVESVGETEDQLQDSVEYETASSCSAAAYETSDEVVADESTRPQSVLQESVAIDGASIQDSRKSLFFNGSKVMESQQGGEIDDSSNTELQQGSSIGGTQSQLGGATGGTESQQGGVAGGADSQQGAAGGAESQQGAAGGAESQQGAAGGAESQLGGAAGGPSRQDSQDCSSFSWETAVGDSSCQLSHESGVVGGVSNSPESSPANGTESWEGVAAPIIAHNTCTLSSERLSTRAVPRRNEDESEQVIDHLTRASDRCFSKCAFICDYLRPCSRQIRKSKIFKHIKVILMFIAMITFFMGMANLSRCSARDELPILCAFLGMAGFILLFFSLVLKTTSLFFPNVNRYYLTAGIVITLLVFFGLFGAVLHFTYTMSPSFDPAHQENSCDSTLYYFAYYTNFITAGIVVLAFFTYVPTMLENIDVYERF